MNTTQVKLRVLRRLGENDETCAQMARHIGHSPTGVSLVLSGKRHTPSVQQAIAKYLGMTVGDLFGPWAWFRVAARKLRERQRLAG